MSGSSFRDMDAGVYARLVLASADGVTGADKARVGGNNNSSTTRQFTPSGAVKPTTTSGSSSRRRLTSLSLRSAGYSDVEAPATKSSGHLHHINKIPTPGSTMHTRSTSSFSSWSVGSLNAPREGSTKVPDIRTIVDLATGRVGRVTAAKVGPSPSGSVGNGAGFNSSRSTYPCSTPPGPHATPVRPLRETLDNPASQHRHRNPSPSNSAGTPRIPISPLVNMAAMEQAAGLATKGGAAAAPETAANAKTAGDGRSSKATNPTPPRCPAAAAPHRKINGRQPGVVAASSRARRPPFNPYRIAARKASPRNLDNARRQRGRQRRRAKDEGTAALRRRRGRTHGEQLGGCSTLASSPSSSSSSSCSSSSESCGKTYAVEWIWPARSVGTWSPRVAARRHRTAGVAAKAAATKGPPSASRSSSSPSMTPSGSRRRMGFGVQAWSHGTAGAGGRDAGGSGWTSTQPYSEASDDPSSSRPPARGAPTVAGAQRCPTRSPWARTGGEAARGGGVARRDGVVPARETFHPDGRGGWVRPPPRPLDTEGATPRAPHSSSAFPAAGASGEKHNANAEEDICDLAPLLMTRRRVSVRRTAATARAPSSGHTKANRTAAAAAAAAPTGRWWKAVRKLFDGRGGASPPPPPSSPPVMTQEESDSNFLNPFSPNSYRRFSTCSVDAGACDGYVSEYSGYESGDGGGGGGGAAAAASRISRQVFADFNLEERVIGCIFGEEDGAASDDEVAREGELGREDPGEDEHQAEELTRGGGENQTNPFPFPPRSSPRAGLLLDDVWPPPAAVIDSNAADGSDDCGGDWLTPAPGTTTAQSTIEDMLALTKAAVAGAADPDSTRPSSTCSITSGRSATTIADANAATSAAASAATAAAIAEQASLAASVAAVTAKQVRDAFRFAGVDPVVEIPGSDDEFSSVAGAE